MVRIDTQAEQQPEEEEEEERHSPHFQLSYTYI
jgi:hypothetical protein